MDSCCSRGKQYVGVFVRGFGGVVVEANPTRSKRAENCNEWRCLSKIAARCRAAPRCGDSIYRGRRSVRPCGLPAAVAPSNKSALLVKSIDFEHPRCLEPRKPVPFLLAPLCDRFCRASLNLPTPILFYLSLPISATPNEIAAAYRFRFMRRFDDPESFKRLLN